MNRQSFICSGCVWPQRHQLAYNDSKKLLVPPMPNPLPTVRINQELAGFCSAMIKELQDIKDCVHEMTSEAIRLHESKTKTITTLDTNLEEKGAV